MDPSVNVFGETLQGCNDKPKTGFFRDGCCNTSDQDVGSHTVCVEVTQEFLEFSRFRGNDLSTAHPEFNFPGLEARRSVVLVRRALARSARAGHGAARALEGHAFPRARDRAARAAEEVRRRSELARSRAFRIRNPGEVCATRKDTSGRRTVRRSRRSRCSAARGRKKGRTVEWPVYGGSLAAQHYSPLEQINAQNVKDLARSRGAGTAAISGRRRR